MWSGARRESDEGWLCDTAGSQRPDAAGGQLHQCGLHPAIRVPRRVEQSEFPPPPFSVSPAVCLSVCMSPSFKACLNCAVNHVLWLLCHVVLQTCVCVGDAGVSHSVCGADPAVGRRWQQGVLESRDSAAEPTSRTDSPPSEAQCRLSPRVHLKPSAQERLEATRTL